MQRRSFFKALAGLIAGGVGALLTGKAEAADHIRDATKKVKTPLDFWDHEDEDVYSEADGEPVATCGTTGNFRLRRMQSCPGRTMWT